MILSAPTVNAPQFTESVQITGQFSEAEAEALAAVLSAGALPITLAVQSTTFAVH